MRLIPEAYRDLVADETKAFAFLATTMEDGTPQVTPVWFNTADEYILINSARGRVKDRNMRSRPAVAIVLMAMDDPYHYLQIRGRVVEIIEEGAEAHFDALYRKYYGRPWVRQPGNKDVRVIYKISTERVVV